MKETRTRLYVEVIDNETATSEMLVLAPFDEREESEGINEDRDTFMQKVERHGQMCFKVKVDQGFMLTTCYYPIQHFSIGSISLY